MKKLLLCGLSALALAGCKAEILCATGQTLCGDHCISTDLDAENCGGCGIRCRSHEQCDAGACTGAPGTTSCGGVWVDLVTDPAHCGACGAVCSDPTSLCRAEDGATCRSVCPTGTAPCGAACVAHDTDRFHCGACGVECRRGESCRGGACVPELYVACFATDDVRPVSAELQSGIPRPAGDGPVFLEVEGPRVHVSSSLSHSVTTFSASLREPGYEHVLGRGDLENLTAHGGRLYVSNSDAGTLVVMRGDTGGFVDEVVLSPRPGSNPRGAAFVGDVAYVALAGKNLESGGQEIAVVDFSGARGVVTARIPVGHLASPDGLAFPSGVLAVGDKVYVTVANLKLGTFGYTDPAGPSKLAVLDTSVDPVAVSSVDLGADCANAGSLALEGTTLWVTCGDTWPPSWAGHVLPIELSGGVPEVKPAIATGAVWCPWNIAFCRGFGYVTDACSGSVFRFDPTGAANAVTETVCPLGPKKWAFTADVACAP